MLYSPKIEKIPIKIPMPVSSANTFIDNFSNGKPLLCAISRWREGNKFAKTKIITTENMPTPWAKKKETVKRDGFSTA